MEEKIRDPIPLGHFLLVRTYQNTSSFTVNILYGTMHHQT